MTNSEHSEDLIAAWTEYRSRAETPTSDFGVFQEGYDAGLSRHAELSSDADVERVARAIYDARALDLDQEDDDWDGLPNDWQEEWRDLARAAITAMRAES